MGRNLVFVYGCAPNRRMPDSTEFVSNIERCIKSRADPTDGAFTFPNVLQSLNDPDRQQLSNANAQDLRLFYGPSIAEQIVPLTIEQEL